MVSISLTLIHTFIHTYTLHIEHNRALTYVATLQFNPTPLLQQQDSIHPRNCLKSNHSNPAFLQLQPLLPIAARKSSTLWRHAWPATRGSGSCARHWKRGWIFVWWRTRLESLQTNFIGETRDWNRGLDWICWTMDASVKQGRVAGWKARQGFKEKAIQEDLMQFCNLTANEQEKKRIETAIPGCKKKL